LFNIIIASYRFDFHLSTCASCRDRSNLFTSPSTSSTMSSLDASFTNSLIYLHHCTTADPTGVTSQFHMFKSPQSTLRNHQNQNDRFQSTSNPRVSAFFHSFKANVHFHLITLISILSNFTSCSSIIRFVSLALHNSLQKTYIFCFSVRILTD